MRRITLAFALLTVGALSAGAAGCGQKGALYLPDQNGSVVTRPAVSSAAPGNAPSEAPANAPPRDVVAPASAAPVQPNAAPAGSDEKKDNDTSQTPK
jgi:predicted small lipoprotein YifL